MKKRYIVPKSNVIASGDGINFLLLVSPRNLEEGELTVSDTSEGGDVVWVRLSVDGSQSVKFGEDPDSEIWGD